MTENNISAGFLPTSEKKKVLIFSLAYRPLIGGAEIALEEITKRQTEISPNYVFIGSKPVYPNKVNLNSVNYIANPNYQPVCQSGGAKLFRRL